VFRDCQHSGRKPDYSVRVAQLGQRHKFRAYSRKCVWIDSPFAVRKLSCNSKSKEKGDELEL